jgi:hypothetical protein
LTVGTATVHTADYNNMRKAICDDRLYVRVPTVLAQALDQYSCPRGWKRSDAVREAVREYLERRGIVVDLSVREPEPATA